MNKLIIFDLDGVIFNSKPNMSEAWREVRNKFNLKISFDKYFNNIGVPFKDILNILKIKKNLFKEISKVYKENSIKKFNTIKIYPGVNSTIHYLKKKNYKLAILTSKERSRTSIILKKFNLNFKYVQCPTRNIGKPNPKILHILNKKLNFNKKDIYYLGDTNVDYIFAKKSKINFIFCNYGYGKIYNKSVLSIKKFSDLKKIF